MNLVFAAGFLVPQQILVVDYFRGLRAAFPGACFPKVPVTGSIEARARALVDEITRFAFPDPAAPIHIVAHSMGGMDARFALHGNLSGLAARVASLSTIATPHRGSPVADFLVGPGGGGLRDAVNAGLARAVEEFGVSTGALNDLTTAKAAQFNRDHPDIGTIPCHCYAGNKVELLSPLRLMHEYIRHVGQTDADKDNDGLVSVASASWKPLAEPPWPTDHLGEVGHSVPPPLFAPGFDHLAAFRRVVARATGP